MNRKRNNCSSSQISFPLTSQRLCLTTKSVGWEFSKCRTKTNLNHLTVYRRKVLNSVSQAFWLRVITWRKKLAKMIKVSILHRNLKKSRLECLKNLQLMMSLTKYPTQTGLSFNYTKFKRPESVLLSFQQKKIQQEKRTIPSARKPQVKSIQMIIAIPLLTKIIHNPKIITQDPNNLKRELFWQNAPKMASGPMKK